MRRSARHRRSGRSWRGAVHDQARAAAAALSEHGAVSSRRGVLERLQGPARGRRSGWTAIRRSRLLKRDPEGRPTPPSGSRWRPARSARSASSRVSDVEGRAAVPRAARDERTANPERSDGAQRRDPRILVKAQLHCPQRRTAAHIQIPHVNLRRLRTVTFTSGSVMDTQLEDPNEVRMRDMFIWTLSPGIDGNQRKATKERERHVKHVGIDVERHVIEAVTNVDV